MAQPLHIGGAVLETSAAIGMLLFPVWVTLTFLWWRRLAPPRLALARVYMVVGALWSLGNLAHAVMLSRPFAGYREVVHHLIQQYLGAVIVLTAMYAEIFVRWLRVRQRVDHPAPMWILRRAGRRR